MRLKNACVIEKITLHDIAAARSDPDVAAFVEMAAEELGENGRFVIRFSGIPQENMILAEGKSEELCRQWIEQFKMLLRKKGYPEHGHQPE